ERVRRAIRSIGRLPARILGSSATAGMGATTSGEQCNAGMRASSRTAVRCDRAWEGGAWGTMQMGGAAEGASLRVFQEGVSDEASSAIRGTGDGSGAVDACRGGLRGGAH